MCPEILLIAGYFDFHLDDLADDDSRKFIEVLETFRLIEHVMVLTYVSNHILDINVTRSSSDIKISEIQASLFLFDFCFLECNLSVPRPNLRKKEIQFRRMRHIDVDAFKSDIVSSNICNEPGSSLDDLMQRYDDTLSCILDKHASVQKKMIEGTMVQR